MKSNFSIDGFQLAHLSEDSVLRERRVILGLTQQAVADRAKIPLQSYQNFESGKRNISRASFSIACRVLEALELDITKFFHNDYALGEEVAVKGGELYYKKTGKNINEDVE